MSALGSPPTPLEAEPPLDVPTLDVVIPVYNEARALEASVRRVNEYLDELPYSFRITVADNASNDGTGAVAESLAATLPSVRVCGLPSKGRGGALRRAWLSSQSPVLIYMDVDLSTGLNALLPLVAPLLSGHSDLAIGSRLSTGSRTLRGAKRELISRGYNTLLRTILGARFADAQCGFKAIRRDVAHELLPLVRDDAWFFDTELLVLAEHAGLRVHEVPVDWADDPDSRVDIGATVRADVRGILRIGWTLLRGQVPLRDIRMSLARPPGVPARGMVAAQMVMFALVGVVSTLAYAGCYVLMRTLMSAQGANLVALLLTAIGNTAANRRLTFGVRGRRGGLRHHGQGLLLFAFGLAVTSGSLWLLQQSGTDESHGIEVVVLTAANLFVTISRFVLMRVWVFRRKPATREDG